MAVSTFVGATTAATVPWLLVPVVIVWAYVAGLVVCPGPRLSVAVLQWSVGLLIAIGLPLGPADAALRAGLVLAGGLFQAAPVAGVLGSPGQVKVERAALAESYRALAEYASTLAAGRFGPPSPVALPANNALGGPEPAAVHGRTAAVPRSARGSRTDPRRAGCAGRPRGWPPRGQREGDPEFRCLRRQAPSTISRAP